MCHRNVDKCSLIHYSRSIYPELAVGANDRLGKKKKNLSNPIKTNRCDLITNWYFPSNRGTCLILLFLGLNSKWQWWHKSLKTCSSSHCYLTTSWLEVRHTFSIGITWKAVWRLSWFTGSGRLHTEAMEEHPWLLFDDTVYTGSKLHLLSYHSFFKLNWIESLFLGILLRGTRWNWMG